MAAGKAEYSIPIIADVKKQDIFFKNADGNLLHGWLFEEPGAKKIVLLSHGNAGNIGHRLFLVEAILNAGASIFIYDYRGYGLSHGEPTIPRIMRDAEAAYDYLHITKKIPASNIIVYGESIGGGMAAHILKVKETGGIILDSTFTSIFNVAQKLVPMLKVYPAFLGPDPALDVKSALVSTHVPVFIVHGAKDDMIPYSEAEENFAAANEPKQFLSLPNCTHNNKFPDFKLFCDKLKSYFRQLD